MCHPSSQPWQQQGLSGRTRNCSDVPQLSPSAVCAGNECIISCSGCKLGSEAGRVSPPQGACACVVPSPASQPWDWSTGLALGRGVGHGVWHGCRGFTLCPLQRVREVGLLPSPFWAGYGPRSLPRAGVLLEQRPEDSLPSEVPAHVNGCRVSL